MAVITISRRLGSGGATIARAIAKELGFHLLDRELVDIVARHHATSPAAALALDERASGWATSIFNSVLQAMAGQQITQESYNYVAARVIHEAAERTDVVILGRGAQVILGKAPKTFHVHVVAPLDERVARIVARESVTPAQARRLIEASDVERRRHVRSIGPFDWDDPLLYDLVLNTGRLRPEAGAGVVILAARIAGVVAGPPSR